MRVTTVAAPRTPRLARMCGIVGYVGDKQARDVVIEGLRRLEYRGYDSAGIALVDDGAIVSDKRAGKLANLEKAIEETPLPASTTGIGHTRWATHGAPNDVNAHPHLGQHGRVAVVHNGIIENFAPLRAELERERPRPALGDRHRGRRAPARGRALERERRPDHRDAERSAAGSRARSPWSPWTRRTPTAWWRARRNSPLVVGLGEGENFLGSDVAAFIEHTREALELGQDQVVTITRDDVAVTDFDGQAGGGPALPRRLGPLGRREGRLRLVHAQGDLRAAARRRRRAAGPARRRRAAAARRGADHRGRAARHRQDHHHRLRHGELRRPGREVRHRALDPDPLRGRARPRVPLPRPDPDPQHPGRRDQPVRRDRRHPDGDPLRPRSSGPRCSRSATPTARRSRASPTR